MESVPYVLRDRYTFFLFSYPNREKMKQSERIVIEDSYLIVTYELLLEWRGIFKKFSVYSDFSFVSRTGSEATYFSEIEVNYWHKDGAFIDFFSIIIFCWFI